MVLGTLGASMLGKMLIVERAIRAGKGVIRAGTGANINHMGKKIQFYYIL